MNLVQRTVTLLDDWSLSRNPHPADARHIIGSWAAKSVLQYFAVEYLVHLTWEHYSYTVNVVSDLGARGCQGSPGQVQCRTSFVVADLSFVFLGVGAVVAAFLITAVVLRVGGRYTEAVKAFRLSRTRLIPRPPARDELFRHLGGEHFGQPLTRGHGLALGFRVALGASGLAMIGVGLMPEDYIPLGHYISTGVFLAGAVTALALLGFLWLEPRRAVAIFLIALAALALVGGLGFASIFVCQLLGVDISGWPMGLFERFVVYAFISGMATMGFTLSSGAQRRAQNTAPRPANLPTDRPAEELSISEAAAI